MSNAQTALQPPLAAGVARLGFGPLSLAGLKDRYAHPDSGSRFIELGGFNVHYRDEGDRNKPVLVLIHGVVASLHTWDDWLPAFAADYRVIRFDVPGFGPLSVDVSYGGNYYAIVEPQGAYTGLDDLGASRIVELSRTIRELVREQYQPVHPLEPSIKGVSHVLWADKPKGEGADGRNAVFYGERAIDRSPCGTGTSARLAHLAAKGKLKVGDRFVHESYICSRFIGRVEAETMIGDQKAIIPSIEGSAIATGFNTIWVDREDPFWAGFTVV